MGFSIVNSPPFLHGQPLYENFGEELNFGLSINLIGQQKLAIEHVMNGTELNKASRTGCDDKSKNSAQQFVGNRGILLH